MYVSHFYREEDLNKIADFLREHGFATLVLAENNIPVASHLLVDFQTDSDGTWLFSGHMARANPLWQKFDSKREVLLIFGGPNSYISPTWYNHLNVPTWNYIAVHLYGFPRLIDGGDELRDILSRLIQRYETNSSYRMETLPPDFAESQMQGAVGFQIKVTRLEANFKLSQNRDDEDHAHIIQHLKERGDEQSVAIAEQMRKYRQV
ncbi:MAG TPA: FMN-binding negative transcriptional regulator [Anaerolineales bacterium]|nr:FMN-binding negative transcriptional regulator [Anaerolineales bacterium]